MPESAPTTDTIAPGKYYRVTVKGIFNAQGEHYEPSSVYHVPDSVYNGKLDDGSTSFASMCATADPEDSY